MQETLVLSLGQEDPLEDGMPDWASPQLSPSVESCGCGLGPGQLLACSLIPTALPWVTPSIEFPFTEASV